MNQEVNVVGLTFVNKDPLFETLRPSGIVTLIPDPTNKYDKNAIGVWIPIPDVNETDEEHNVRIGFIPAKDGGDILQKEILALIADGKPPIAKVVKYSYHDKDIGFNEDHIGRLQSCTLMVNDAENADVYVTDAGAYRRITDLLGCYEPDGKDGADRIIKWACDLGSFEKYKARLNKLAKAGTKMHKANENWMGGDEEEDVPEGFLNWWDKYQPEIVAIEQKVYDDSIMVAGTYDLLCKIVIDGKTLLVAVDWKSSKAVRKKHRIQVGFYGYMAQADEAWVVAFGATTKQGYSMSRVDRDGILKQYHKVELLAELQELE